MLPFMLIPFYSVTCTTCAKEPPDQGLSQRGKLLQKTLPANSGKTRFLTYKQRVTLLECH